MLYFVTSVSRKNSRSKTEVDSKFEFTYQLTKKGRGRSAKHQKKGK